MGPQSPTHPRVQDSASRSRSVPSRNSEDPLRNVRGPKIGAGGRNRTALDQQARLMAKVPGPASYQNDEYLDFALPEGGRLNRHPTVQKYSWQDEGGFLKYNPKPGFAEIATKNAAPKAAGRPVWRYESATIGSTKHLVTKTLGVKNDPPGPGAYTLPEPPLIAQPPSLKGRSGGAMAHMPEASHPPVGVGVRMGMAGLSPDAGDKFAGPLRDKNSGDQIFGRDLRKGTAVDANKSTRPSTGGDKLDPADLPLSMGASVFDAPPENSVQWRAGGFSVIKKSKSSSAVQQRREHPVMEATAKHYPTLSRQHKRDDNVFLPMASRKNNGFTPIPTNEHSTEHEQLRRSKWVLADVIDNLSKATASALEPLNEEKMRAQALYSLKKKAEERMRLEGVASEQQALVLAELPKVFEEKVLLGSAAAREV